MFFGGLVLDYPIMWSNIVAYGYGLNIFAHVLNSNTTKCETMKNDLKVFNNMHV